MSFFRIHPIFIALIVLAACAKEQDLEQPYNPSPAKMGVDLWPDAKNPHNPYEHLEVGIYHNHAVEHFRQQHRHYASTSQWKEAAPQITIDYFCIYMPVYCDSGLTAEQLDELADTALNDSLLTLQLQGLPLPVQNHLDSLWMLTAQKALEAYSDFKAAVVALEKIIEEDSSLEAQHREMLLCATQVARYSCYYWKRQLADAFQQWDNPGTGFGPDDLAAVVGKDIFGGVVGYQAGLPQASELAYSAKAATVGSVKKLNEVSED